MHAEAYEFVKQTVEALRQRGTVFEKVVEFGGRDVNGTIRHLFCDAESYISIDRIPGPGVDAIADAETYTPPEPVQCVVCCEVLEHAKNAYQIVMNALRILEPGGVFILTCATDGRMPHSAITGGPLLQNEYYKNIEITELDSWLFSYAAFAKLAINPKAHDLYCVAMKAHESPLH